MKKILIAFLLLLVNLSFAQNAGKKVTMDQLIDSTAITKWISENSYNMEKGNNILAYKEVDSIARVKKIIGLGEPAHGVKTIYENRNELAKYLIQNGNYNIIALEMHFNVGLKINEYITTGKGNLKEILKSGHFFTNCQEYIDFFEWMKDYNSKTNKKVMVYGMDIQSNIDLLEDLFLYLNNVDKNIKESTDHLDKMFTKRNIWEYSSFKKAKRDSVKQFVNVLVQKFENSKTQYIKNSDEKTYALNHLRLTVFKNFMQLNESFDFKSHDITERIDFRSLIIRDSCSAQLIRSILKLEGENSKMIIMAHSGHLCKNGFLRQMENTFSVNGFYKLFKPTGITGWWLNEMIGSDYYFIGYQIGQGKFMGFNPEKEYKMEPISITPPEFPSVNYHLSKANKKYYFLPMNFNKNTPKNVAFYFYSFQPYYEIGAANDLKYMQTNAEYYDAIIYCNDVEASINYTESE